MDIDHLSFDSESEESVEIVSNRNEQAPWLTEHASSITNPNLRLHTELIDFYHYIRPSKQELELKRKTFNQVKSLLEEKFPDSKVLPYGSFATQIFLPNSDIDIVIVSNEQKNNQRLLNKCGRYLYEHNDLFTEVNVLRKAKVPIIKFRHKETQIEFDLAINELGGAIMVPEVLRSIESHPEIPYLLFPLKLFLRQRRLNNPYTGGLGSFLLFCMILAFLREFKSKLIHSHNVSILMNISLSDYLINFLSFYGLEFKYRDYEIVMSEGGQIRRRDDEGIGFRLISPQDNGRDIGAQMFKFRDIFQVFKNRFNVLTSTQMDPGESILAILLNPSRQKFKKYLE